MKEKTEATHFTEKEIMDSELEIIRLYSGGADQIKPLRLLLQFFKGHYVRLFFSAVFYFIKSSPQWALPLVTADVIDLVTRRPDNIAVRLMIDFAIALALLAQNIPLHMLYVRLFNRVSRGVEAGMRGAMIRKLQQLSISFHKEMESGRIQSKVMRDVETISDFTRSLFDTGLNVIFNLTISLAVVFTRNLTVFFMFLVCVPFAVAVRNLFARKIRRQSHEFRKEIEHTSAAVFDMEELVPVTRAHALENKEIRKLTDRMTHVAESGLRLDYVQHLFGSVNWVIFFFFQVLCLFFTANLALRGQITVGEITLYQSYFGSLVGQVSSIIGLLPVIARGTESIRSVGEILSAYDVEDNTDKKKLTRLSGAYEFRHVCFDYDDKTPVLRDFSLSVKPGETVALVGESGSGKSTVINLVIGFNKAQSGEVLIDGIPIDTLDLHAYRKMISVVPQNSILFSGTIRENITYGQPDISEERLWAAVRAARLESVIEKLPEGLDTRVGEHGSKLSGGQRQRISIARAIIREPRVIIFDEATSALDSVTEREIQAAIDHLTADRTTFIVAHRLSTIRRADKIAVLREGRCVECGTYEELMAKKGEYYRYEQLQS